MRVPFSSQPRSKNARNASQLILRQAKQLHRAASSESTASSLPVLRRLLASKAIAERPLPELHRRRDSIQRKHILRMLALEAGFSSWERYRDSLKDLPAEALAQFDVMRNEIGYPNLWFSTLVEAEVYVAEHGGKAVAVGGQALVVLQS